MSTTATQTEIARLAQKLNFRTAVNYKKHISLEATFEDNLLTLLRLAADEQERELLKRRLKLASFPIQKTLDTFDFANARLPNLNKEQVMELATCEFIKERTNIVAIGNCGTGKSHIATAIGMEAIRRGYSVRFRRANDLITQLSEAKSDKHLAGMLKSLFKCQLLVLDELGYLTLDQKSSNLLFQVLAQRYEVRSTIVTSNLEFSKWPDFIGDPLLANALVDRLVHRSAVLNMNGEGYRLRDGRK
jgi:DNA replication protein DnaC